ncbi:MAG: DinB family protein [Fimbriimonadaceae bacterium]|nr:DinB family protein [Fimbriimonadaceae bacterium]
MLEQLLDSWDRQARIIDSLAGLVTEEVRKAQPSPDGMALDMQLAHIHHCRRGWLNSFDPARLGESGRVLVETGDGYVVIEDLDQVRAELRRSAASVRAAVQAGMESGGGSMGPYENPILFLQHMVWHEGWHAGLLMLGLRLAGREPPETWEETHIWELWRGPEG